MKTLICLGCKSLFDEPVYRKEYIGEAYGYESYEEFPHCPNCDSEDFEEYDDEEEVEIDD